MIPPLLYQLILTNAEETAFAEFAQFAEFAEFNQTDFLVRNLHFREM
jgi:hypothetical protein